jgi:hypothetical protein
MKLSPTLTSLTLEHGPTSLTGWINSSTTLTSNPEHEKKSKTSPNETLESKNTSLDLKSYSDELSSRMKAKRFALSKRTSRLTLFISSITQMLFPSLTRLGRPRSSRSENFKKSLIRSRGIELVERPLLPPPPHPLRLR